MAQTTKKPEYPSHSEVAKGLSKQNSDTYFVGVAIFASRHFHPFSVGEYRTNGIEYTALKSIAFLQNHVLRLLFYSYFFAQRS